MQRNCWPAEAQPKLPLGHGRSWHSSSEPSSQSAIPLHANDLATAAKNDNKNQEDQRRNTQPTHPKHSRGRPADAFARRATLERIC